MFERLLKEYEDALFEDARNSRSQGGPHPVISYYCALDREQLRSAKQALLEYHVALLVLAGIEAPE